MDLLSCSEVQALEAEKAKNEADVVSKELIETHLGDLFYQIRLNKKLNSTKVHFSPLLFCNKNAINKCDHKSNDEVKYELEVTEKIMFPSTSPLL